MAKKEQSFGIIPLRQRAGQWEVLLILHRKGHWAFPKGHRDRGEEPLQTAVRELREETGLEIARFVAAPPLSERYFFTWEGQKVDKSVEYYLAEVSGEVVLQVAEVSDYRWLPIKEAEAVVTYAEAKRLCREVEKYL
ncbi:MAG: putative mutator protein MutT4 [Chlamydiae bacterium]|nr:putative mutator protein MutT4 [Chlamydiota bacterium]